MFGLEQMQKRLEVLKINSLNQTEVIQQPSEIEPIQQHSEVEVIQQPSEVESIIGVQGNIGMQGLSGIIGVQGNIGMQGLSGIIGVQGDIGMQGLSGIIGLQGDIGPQGVSCNCLQDSSSIYNKTINSIVTILIRGSSGGYYVGQGFWYEKKDVNSAYLITAAHVILDPENQDNDISGNIWVNTTYPINTIYKIDGVVNQVIGLDKTSDVAVLKIQGNYFPSLYSLNSRTSVKPGQEVLIIGYPYGIDIQSVTKGVVRDNKSQVNVYSNNVNSNFMESVLTDASVYEGNSGGPILNNEGKWIGILSWGLGKDGSLNGGVASYLAVPLINYFIDNYKGSILTYPKGYIGINVTTIDMYLSVIKGISSVNGYLVTGNDPLIQSFNIGDIIISVNGVPVGIMNDEYCLFTEIQLPKAGSQVSIRYRPVNNYNTILIKTLTLNNYPSDKDYIFSGYLRTPIQKKDLKVKV